MKNWKNNLVPILWAIGGIGWLVRVVKQLVKEEPPSLVNITFALLFFTFAFVFRARGVAARRKSEGVSRPRPSA